MKRPHDGDFSDPAGADELHDLAQLLALEPDAVVFADVDDHARQLALLQLALEQLPQPLGPGPELAMAYANRAALAMNHVQSGSYLS